MIKTITWNKTQFVEYYHYHFTIPLWAFKLKTILFNCKMTTCKYNPFQATARAISILCDILRSSHWRRSMEKLFLNFPKIQRILFRCPTGACNFFKKETSTQVVLCEFCEIVKNIFFTENLGPTILKLVLVRQNIF